MKITKSNITSILPKVISDPYNIANSLATNDLVNLLKILSAEYYKTNKPLVPDAIYDIIRDVLEEKEPNHPYLNEVGYQITRDKVKLPFYMPSLNKIKPTTEYLKVWRSNFKGPYTISDKLDGVSALLYKTNGEFKLFTRGDAVHGKDISHLIPYVFRVDLSKKPMDNNTAIRGELIISKKNFKKVEDDYKNVRNTVSGLVNNKRVNVKVAKITDFVAYSIVNPNYTHSIQLQLLKKWRLPTVEVITKDSLTNKFLSSYLQKRRNESLYDIDGIVVVDSGMIYEPYSENPEYAFAFKMVLSDQLVEAVVVDIEWNVSKRGYINPVVRINPVKVGGVTIKNVTAFNAKYVVDRKLGPGAVIKLVRSGDVIPYIVDVLKPSSSKKPKMPDIPYVWNETGVNIVVKGDATLHPEMVVKQIANFFTNIGVSDIGEGIVSKLVNAGYSDIFTILKAKKEDLIKIDGIGARLVDKLYASIHGAFKKVKLEQLMAGSNVFNRGLGTKKFRLILAQYPDILKEDPKTLKKKIMEIEGFSDKTADNFVSGLPKFKVFYEKLKKISYIDLSHLETKVTKKKGSKFQGMKIVFTGFRDSKLEEYIINNGGTVSTTVSKNTNLVIYKPGGETSSKYLKAKELNIKLCKLEQFLKVYKVGRGS